MNVPVIPPVGLVLSEQQVLAGDPPGGEVDFTAILQAILAGSGEKVTLPGSPACNGLLPIIGSVGTALPEGAGETAAAAGGSAGERGYPARDRAGARADNSLELLALAGQMIQVAGCQAAVPGEEGELPDLQAVNGTLPGGCKPLTPGELLAAKEGPVKVPPGGTGLNRQPVEVMLTGGLAPLEPRGEPPAAVTMVAELLATVPVSSLTADESGAGEGPGRSTAPGAGAEPAPENVSRQTATVGKITGLGEPSATDGLPAGLLSTGRTGALNVGEPEAIEREGLLKETTKGTAREAGPCGPHEAHPVKPLSSGRKTGEPIANPVPGVEPPPLPVRLAVTAVTDPAEERNTEVSSLPDPGDDPSERDFAFRLVRQVADRLRWPEGAEKIKLHFRLKPDHLGQVHVRLSFSEGGRLQADFRVENLPAQEAVKAGVLELKEALQEHGIRLEGFNVELGGEGFHGFQPRGGPPVLTGRNGLRGSNLYREVEEVASRANLGGLMGLGSQVDYLV